MSTSAESALQWLDEKQPDNQQIQQVIEKLEYRLQHSGAAVETLQGSQEALELLKEVLDDRQTSEPPPSAPEAPIPTSAPSEESQLDFTPLGQHSDMAAEQLSPEEKLARFQRLKNQLSNTK